MNIRRGATSPYMKHCRLRITNSNTKLEGGKNWLTGACEVTSDFPTRATNASPGQQGSRRAPGTCHIALRLVLERETRRHTVSPGYPMPPTVIQGVPVSRHSERVQAPLIETATTPLFCAYPRIWHCTVSSQPVRSTSPTTLATKS
jgi:hypothetical protein